MYAHTILRAVMVTDASVHYLLSVPLVNAYPSDSCTLSCVPESSAT